jgi:hypothetical protein
VRLPPLKNVQAGIVLEILLGQAIATYELDERGVLVVPLSNANPPIRWLGDGRPECERELHRKLAQNATLANALEVTTLFDAMKILSKQYDFNSAVHHASFPPRFFQGVDNATVQLPPINNKPLDKVLHTLLDQVGGTYEVHDNVVVVIGKVEKTRPKKPKP